MKKLSIILIMFALMLFMNGQAFAGSSTQGDTSVTVCAAATRTTIYPAALAGDTKVVSVVKVIFTSIGDTAVSLKIEDRWQNQYNGDSTAMYTTRHRLRVPHSESVTWTPESTSKFCGLFVTADVADSITATLYYK